MRATAAGFALALMLASCGPLQDLDRPGPADVSFSFDHPAGWRAPSPKKQEAFEREYAQLVGADVASATTLESIHRDPPTAVLNVTVDPAPSDADLETELENVNLNFSTEPRAIDLGGEEALVVNARQKRDTTMTRTIIVTVRDDLTIAVIFSTGGGASPIGPLERDIERIIESWTWNE